MKLARIICEENFFLSALNNQKLIFHIMNNYLHSTVIIIIII